MTPGLLRPGVAQSLVSRMIAVGLVHPPKPSEVTTNTLIWREFKAGPKTPPCPKCGKRYGRHAKGCR